MMRLIFEWLSLKSPIAIGQGELRPVDDALRIFEGISN